MLALDDVAVQTIGGCFIVAFPIIAGWIKFGQHTTNKKIDQVNEQLVGNGGDSHHDKVLAQITIIGTRLDDIDRRIKVIENANQKG